MKLKFLGRLDGWYTARLSHRSIKFGPTRKNPVLDKEINTNLLI
jgi:hypothetical protein